MKYYKYYILTFSWPSMEDSGSFGLNKLLKEGWNPVRETPMGGCPVGGKDSDGMAFVFASLILLEKEG